MTDTVRRPTAHGAPSTQWDAIAVSFTLLALAAAFLLWRAHTPSGCATLQPSAAAWGPEGLAPTAQASCPQPSTAIIGVHRDAGWVRLDLATGGQLALATTDGGDDIAQNFVAGAWTLLFVAATFIVCTVAFVHRRDDHSAGATLVFSSALLSSTLVSQAGLPVEAAFEGWGRWLFLLSTQGAFSVMWGAALLAAVLFPIPMAPALGRLSDRLAIGGTPVSLWAFVTLAILAATRNFPALMHYSTRANYALTTLTVLTIVVTVFARVAGLRREGADPVARLQMLWLGGSGVVSLMLTLSFWIVPSAVTGASLLPDELIGLPGLIFVGGFSIALLRWRLFELEWLLVRVLVVTAMLLLVLGVYILAGWAIRTLDPGLGPHQEEVIALVAAALLAAPMRSRVQQAVNWVIYRDVATPYTILSGVLVQLAARTVDFGRVTSDIGRALRVPKVAIRAPSVNVESRTGPAPEESLPIGFPLAEALGSGELVVWSRGRGDRFTSAESHLLATVAAQIGAAAQQFMLSEEVRRSRKQLVLTREEERRALRAVLHDDLAPTLAGITLQGETAKRLLARDPGAAGRVLDALGQEAMSASQQLRALSYELRPPVLDERGLVAGLADQAPKLAPVHLRVDSRGIAGGLPLTAGVEAAAFRIAMEALANVSRHAIATHCWVDVERGDDVLTVRIRDDGVGLPPDFRSGVGVDSMRERAVELSGEFHIGARAGGGTEVSVTLPLGGDHG